MSDTPFTPGPWAYERDPDANDLPRPWVGLLSESRYAALVCGNGAEEVEANARLIAAAPQLYEALRGIKWRSDDRDNMEFAARITYVQMDVIRAALAKANGEVA